MSPSAARAMVMLLSFAVLAISAVATSLTWTLLAPLELLPRGVISLLAWVTAYYAGANLLLWRAVVRISPVPPAQPT